MPKTLSILLLLAFLAACGPSIPTQVGTTADRQPLKFVAYENNPIISPGEPGSFDDVVVMTPYVIWHNDQFFLFYSGMNSSGKGSIGMATSTDGYHFTRYEGNPIFTPGERGFDSYGVSSSILIRDDSVWVMYYNGTDIALFTPSPFIGRATSKSLTGPWERYGTPILTRGKKSEWDGGFTLINSVLKLEDDRYIMYYTGGTDFILSNEHCIGMAVSADGINWVKYNDPTTTEHPFADSDPVIMSTKRRNINYYPVGASVYKIPGGFEIYYSVIEIIDGSEIGEIAYAISQDGIHWGPFPGNPFYRLNDDHFTTNHYGESIFEFPSLVYHDSLCLMYYDYGINQSGIGMATARVPSTKPGVN